ncbi:MAG: R3H domain-containing nucleic acid-binding protein [Dehalococcoidia bacterium]|jgi:stage III sporulation protein SpoIIIAA
MVEGRLQKIITDDMDAMLDILPPRIRQPLSKQKDLRNLLEVILDLGRPVEARFPGREIMLDSKDVEEADIDYVVTRVGSFGDDNRAGIERTLHRISAIRNRQGRIVGMTCRLGRAIFGTIKIIEDLVQSGKSVMLLGRPGVGKTTMLREVARVLSDDMVKRVIIVDTSNEIAGDGDIPHPAIGRARRMQVATPELQHAVMIEAVENHMPEVIIIDEIGTELEALAARTIAERGVQLVGTAHGNTLDNLMMNPTLSDLIGGIQSVTLGDDEARRRGTQKSILERKSPPTFDIVVEIQDWERVAIHPDVGEAVDALLRGTPPGTELRWIDENGEVKIDKSAVDDKKPAADKTSKRIKQSTRIYAFGVNKSRLMQAARDMNIDVQIVENIREASMFITSRNYYKRKPQKIRDAENSNIPVYVLRSNTPPHMRQLLSSIFIGGIDKPEYFQGAISEAEEAVNQLTDSDEESVELSPQSSYIRRLQHLIAQRSDLSSRSLGKDPQRRVRIYKEQK